MGGTCFTSFTSFYSSFIHDLHSTGSPGVPLLKAEYTKKRRSSLQMICRALSGQKDKTDRPAVINSPAPRVEPLVRMLDPEFLDHRCRITGALRESIIKRYIF